MPETHEIYDEGEQLKEEGKLEDAVAKFQEALQADANFPLAHFALAVALGQLGQHEKAVEHGEKAAQLEPTEPFSYTALSVTYQRAFEGTRDQRFIELAEHAKNKAHELAGH